MTAIIDTTPQKGAKEYKTLPIIGIQPRSEKEEKHLREEVEVEFINMQEPGAMLSFVYGDSKKNTKFKLFHGGKYKLPRHVIRWVQSRGEPIKKYTKDGFGNIHAEVTGHSPRFQFRETMNF